VHRVRITKRALRAYEEAAREARTLAIPITDAGLSGFIWNIAVPPEAFEPNAHLRAWLKRNGRTRQIAVWRGGISAWAAAMGSGSEIVLGEYPMVGDTVILRW
jgi:hypothetical protein